MNKFWELFRESVIIQAVITLVLLVTICWMFATGQDVPETLLSAFMLVLGFYFGSKVQTTIQRR